MVKINCVKKIEKCDIVTRFWYTLKNLDPFKVLNSTQLWNHYCANWMNYAWTFSTKALITLKLAYVVVYTRCKCQFTQN
jgi:hypothetical protein